MTADKVFILLLVILLPLTGCIDMTDNAEAQDESDSIEVSTIPTVYSIYLGLEETATLEFNGTETLKLETHYRNLTGNYSTDTVSDNVYQFAMSCDGVTMIDNGMMALGHYLPVLAGQNCTVFITAGSLSSFYIFSKANLESLK